MSIDEAIERCETLATNGHIIFSRDPDIAEECNEKYKQLAEWLEELKSYRENYNGYNKEDIELNRNAMYNKAIDDFANVLKENYDYLPQILSQEAFGIYIDEYAEQLKAGASDGNG